MALKVQASFAAGELDPALHERTTLEKFKSGLASGRGMIVGKTGRLISRMGRSLFRACKLPDREVLIYSPPYTGYVLEWGHQYVRIYAHEVLGISASFAVGGVLVDDHSHDFTEDDLPYIHFETSGSYVYVFRYGLVTKKLFFGPGGGFVAAASLFAVPVAPTTPNISSTGNGHYVDYAITRVVNGEESPPLIIPGAATNKLPIAVGEVCNINVRCQAGITIGATTEIRVYRRPEDAGAYGYIGSSSQIYSTGSNIHAKFDDLGVAADYSHGPPEAVDNFVFRGGTDARVLNSKTGTIYQQRLLLQDGVGEGIFASRSGHQNNFTRDYPLNSDSALKFKSGTSGSANVLRMIDSDGLVVFTSRGIYLSIGALGPTNLALDRKGNWVIADDVPPIALPGGVLFVDSSTNTIRHLMWSQEAASYAGEELSIFSNHLFTGRKIKSWGFHEGETPVLFAVFTDGKFASFTYERQHEMRAWTPQDSSYFQEDEVEQLNVEAVAATGIPEKTFFLVEKDGERYIELTVPRYVSATIAAEDSESDKNETVAALDSMVSYKTLMNDDLAGADLFVLTENLGPWDDELTLRCGTSALFTTISWGAVGTIFRYFDTEDGTSVDLEVIQRNSDNEVIVMPSCEFPEDQASNVRLYLTAATFTGLTHLEGEAVSIVVDGYVVASPNNDLENYEQVVVASGAITLPDSLRGAIVHIGRPITFDIKTLKIDTVEQRPVLVESLTVNKLLVKVYKSRGLYVGNEFPADDKVDGMQDIDAIDTPGDEVILGNRYQAPQTRRVEVSLTGDWQNQGEICIRQVDPVHFEILSLIPDLEDLRR